MKKIISRNLRYAITIVIILSSLMNSKGQNLNWAKLLNFDGNGNIVNIKVDNNQDVILLIRNIGTIDCDPGSSVFNLTSIGSNDIVFCKYDDQGNLIWAKQIGSIGDDRAYDLMLDDNNNIYFCGETGGGNIDFDPGGGVHNLLTVGFIVKYDPSGNLVWVLPNNVDVDHFKIDKENNIILSGSFSSTYDLDRIHPTNYILPEHFS